MPLTLLEERVSLKVSGSEVSCLLKSATPSPWPWSWGSEAVEPSGNWALGPMLAPQLPGLTLYMSVRRGWSKWRKRPGVVGAERNIAQRTNNTGKTAVGAAGRPHGGEMTSVLSWPCSVPRDPTDPKDPLVSLDPRAPL